MREKKCTKFCNPSVATGDGQNVITQTLGTLERFKKRIRRHERKRRRRKQKGERERQKELGTINLRLAITQKNQPAARKKRLNSTSSGN